MWIDPNRYKSVGAVLELAREKAGLTQVQLAATLKKPQSFISSYEAGQRRIDVLELIRIADALKVDSRRLFADILKSAELARKVRNSRP